MNNSREFELSRFKESLFIIISDLKLKRKNINNYNEEIDKLLNETLTLKCKLSRSDSINENKIFSSETPKNDDICIQCNTYKTEYECKIKQYNELLSQNKESLHSLQTDNYKLKGVMLKLEEENNQLKSQNEILSKGMLKLKEFISELYQKINHLEKVMHNIDLQIQNSKCHAEQYETLTKHYQCLMKHYEEKSKEDELFKVAQITKIDDLSFQIKKLRLKNDPIEKKDNFCLDKQKENSDFCLHMENVNKKLSENVLGQCEKYKEIKEEISEFNNQLIKLQNKLSFSYNEQAIKSERIKSLEDELDAFKKEVKND